MALMVEYAIRREGVVYLWPFPHPSLEANCHPPITTACEQPQRAQELRCSSSLWQGRNRVLVETTLESNATDTFYKGQKFYPENSAHLAFMWLFSCVYQVVFLQVGQLSKTLVAGLAFERPFSTVHSQVDLGRSHRG